jgi:tripartite-type tricarboxylate transporter receptor subunit TctC
MAQLKRLVFAVLSLVGTAMLVDANAQSWPARPIRFILPFPPGGATDVIGRTIGQPLSARLGQPVVVENRPGSNGNIAAELVARSRPDGYTLLLGSDSLYGINPHLYAKMPIDPQKELVPIATLVSNQLLLAVNPTLMPVNDPKEFAAFVKRAAAPMFYASIGNGSQHHLAMELFKQFAGFSMTHVPYKGGGPAGIGLMSGEVAAMFGGGSVLPLAKSGRMRALAVSSVKRSLALPGLPTIDEFYPGYEVNIWQGLMAPLGTSEAIVGRLRTEVNAVLAQPDVAERLANSGSGDPYITTAEEFAALIQRDYEHYGKIIRDAGVKIDE